MHADKFEKKDVRFCLKKNALEIANENRQNVWIVFFLNYVNSFANKYNKSCTLCTHRSCFSTMPSRHIFYGNSTIEKQF